MKTYNEKLNSFGKFLNSQGHEINLYDDFWMEDCIFGEYKIRDMFELYEAYHSQFAHPSGVSDELIDYILEIDFMTTVEFCREYDIPIPKFTGDVKSLANELLQIDAIKHRLFVEEAKRLNRIKSIKKGK